MKNIFKTSKFQCCYLDYYHSKAHGPTASVAPSQSWRVGQLSWGQSTRQGEVSTSLWILRISSAPHTGASMWGWATAIWTIPASRSGPRGNTAWLMMVNIRHSVEWRVWWCSQVTFTWNSTQTSLSTLTVSSGSTWQCPKARTSVRTGGSSPASGTSSAVWSAPPSSTSPATSSSLASQSSSQSFSVAASNCVTGEQSRMIKLWWVALTFHSEPWTIASYYKTPCTPYI